MMACLLPPGLDIPTELNSKYASFETVNRCLLETLRDVRNTLQIGGSKHRSGRSVTNLTIMDGSSLTLRSFVRLGKNHFFALSSRLTRKLRERELQRLFYSSPRVKPWMSGETWGVRHVWYMKFDTRLIIVYNYRGPEMSWNGMRVRISDREELYLNGLLETKTRNTTAK